MIKEQPRAPEDAVLKQSQFAANSTPFYGTLSIIFLLCKPHLKTEGREGREGDRAFIRFAPFASFCSKIPHPPKADSALQSRLQAAYFS